MTKLGTRIEEIQTALADLDAQADKLVGVIIAKRAALTDLAAQRQALVSEADQLMRPMLAADWRDTLRDSGDLSSP
jgi:hypothetical protein